ncbi:MAG TPA: sterol desaturase family protein, partial [Casimicrobium sp.]|nr:sterol desaturase family protein [Casimicrobium sp.]
MENTPFIRIYAVVGLVAIGSAMLEGLVLTFWLRRNYDWKGALVSLAIAVGRRLTDFIPLALALPGAAWLYQHRLFDWKLNDPVAWVVLFFALEFAYYWFHRASHRVRWFWA